MNNYSKQPQVNISVDLLVIDGLNLKIRERWLLRQALESRLKEYFINGGIPENLSSFSPNVNLTGESIHLSDKQRIPGQLGTHLAGSIYKSLNSEK